MLKVKQRNNRFTVIQHEPDKNPGEIVVNVNEAMKHHTIINA